jgi:hypothetical protein
MNVPFVIEERGSETIIEPLDSHRLIAFQPFAREIF